MTIYMCNGTSSVTRFTQSCFSLIRYIFIGLYSLVPCALKIMNSRLCFFYKLRWIQSLNLTCRVVVLCSLSISAFLSCQINI